MKRSRSEHINVAVGTYLRKRQFSDNDTYKKNELKLHQTTQEMAIRGLIMNESSIGNAINFSSISGDATAIDQHFTKLKLFITEAVEPFKTELTHILFPMFVHLYIELVLNGQKTPAQKFHCRHGNLFAELDKYKDIVESLKKIISPSDLNNHQNIKAFRENKYVVFMSDDSLHYLQRFLKDNDHLILLQIFNFHIEIKDPSVTKLHLFEEHSDESSTKSLLTGKNSESKSSSSSAMKLLLQAIKKVQEGPPSLPSICLYTLMNTSQGTSSVALSQDLSFLAAGFENSSIHTWKLVPDECNDEEMHKTAELSNLVQSAGLMQGHSGTVYGLCCSPDSKFLLSCSEDTTVRAWDVNTKSNVAVYRGHNYPIWAIDYSSLGFYFATASQDRTGKLWMLDRTYPLRIFAGHTQDVDSIKFHPNCNYIATGSNDRTVRLWNVQDGKMMRLFQGHRGSIFALAFSPNGQLLASAGEDRRIKIWDLAAGSLFKELRGHVDTVHSLCFNLDSSILISGGLDNNIRAWDIRKGVSYNNSADGHTSPELLGSYITKSTSLLFVRYSPHNHLVAVGAHPL